MSDVRLTSGAPTPRDRLMAQLVADLHPVRRVGPAWLRAAAWLALVALIAAVLAFYADMPAVRARLMGAPDMWLAVVGSTLTAVLAAVAAVQLGLPDRSPRWAALPLPALALWLGASGMGCARTWLVAGASDASMGESLHCLRFIIGLSIPLSAALFLLLRRGYSLYPTLTGATAGLAVAAAAATLLTFFHPFDATVTDLSVHLGAVLVVISANRLLGGYMFRGRMRGNVPAGCGSDL